MGLKAVMLTWEFPPRIIGGIAPHVYNLSINLVKLGVEVHVVTCDFPNTPEYEVVEGVEVHRFDSYNLPTPDFAAWVQLMNLNMQRAATQIIKSKQGGSIIIHAHDWLAAKAGIGLKHLNRVPLVSTIHATEYGRRGGVFSDYNRMIHEIEVWLGSESKRVICCSHFMAEQVNKVLGVPYEKIRVIPNGIDPAIFTNLKGVGEVRSRFAERGEKLVLFVGRLVVEKGVHVLLDAIPKVLQKVEAKFVIAGDGYLRSEVVKRVAERGLGGKVHVTGYLDTDTIRRLFLAADVCVIPSLYEPFGIVALEAMAAGCPVVASDTGGLSEIVEHEKTGVKVYPNNPDSLAWGILRVLESKDL
ncbi:MAG: glycosyltransferase family 4 protein, partial [Thaumarchaeota archaeon]|nr:glycosyltransferase family 4 protein [Nitrososphaerota archaeon]